MRSISVARAFATATVQPAAAAAERVRDIARAEVVLGVEAPPVVAVESSPLAAPEPTPRPTPGPTRARTPAPTVFTLPQLPDPPTAGIVIASWYGPGFYGNRTACG